MTIGDVEHENADGAIRLRMVRPRQGDVQIALRRRRQADGRRSGGADQDQGGNSTHDCYSRQAGDTVSSALIVMRCSPGTLINKPRMLTVWPW